MGKKKVRISFSSPGKSSEHSAELTRTEIEQRNDDPSSSSPHTFEDLGLDDRIVKAVCDMGWKKPTLVQEKFIPLALEGKDILARARTGSGKTAAFALPIVHKILELKQAGAKSCLRALVLAPTKELSQQVCMHFKMMTSSCSREIRVVDLSLQTDLESQKSLLKSCPDIVIGTPSRVFVHIKIRSLSLSSLEFLVIDEADLIFSFGHENDMKEISKELPKICQCFLTSATLSEEVKSLKKLVLHNAAILKLEEAQLPSTTQLTQYHIRCDEEDKFVLIYSLIKLRLIRGKSIIFVNSVDRCYRLKLFLEQFGIRSCVLNSELPINSRCHIVKQLNEGSFDFMVAADEFVVPVAENADQPTVKRKKRFKVDRESGVSRGIDFHQISNVINFDFPDSVESYIHRVGRTARGWNKGTALSFATEKDDEKLRNVSEVLSEQMGSEVFKPYQFRMEELDGFKYRARDVLRAVTSTAVRESRLQEIKGEILNSRKLKSYFQENPRDLAVLKHDKALHTVKQQQHLRDVPDYIVPPTLRGMDYSAPMSAKTKRQHYKKLTRGQQRFHKKRKDPLKSFECEMDED